MLDLTWLQDLNWPYLLFGTRGRIGRASWWIASCALVGMGFGVLSLIGRNIVLAILLALMGLVIVYCLLAVAVKRLHDRNKRGWWILLFAVTPIMLASVVSALGEDWIGSMLDYAAWILVVAIAIWALLEVGFMPGTAGSNRYGPDPLAKAKTDARQGGIRA